MLRTIERVILQANYKLYQENLSVTHLLRLYSTFAVFSSSFTGAAELKTRDLDALFGVFFLGNLTHRAVVPPWTNIMF